MVLDTIGLRVYMMISLISYRVVNMEEVSANFSMPYCLISHAVPGWSVMTVSLEE